MTRWVQKDDSDGTSVVSTPAVIEINLFYNLISSYKTFEKFYPLGLEEQLDCVSTLCSRE